MKHPSKHPNRLLTANLSERSPVEIYLTETIENRKPNIPGGRYISLAYYALFC